MPKLDREELKKLAALARMFDIVDLTVVVRGGKLVANYTEVFNGILRDRPFLHSSMVEHYFDDQAQLHKAIHEAIAKRQAGST